MHIETVQFDDVFDVAPRGGHFSFRSRGRTQYGVRLENGVVPGKGATFAVAFDRPGEWSTVLGWRDLASGDVRLARPDWTLWLGTLTDLLTFGVFFVVGGLLLGGVGVALAVAAAFLYPAVRQMRRNRVVKRALLAA